MEIKKADSKGRVTVGEDGRNYHVHTAEDGTITLKPVPEVNWTGMRIIEMLPGEGKTTALVELMLAPGNDDTVYVAPTKAQADNAFRYMEGMLSGNGAYGWSRAEMRKRFISASGVSSLKGRNVRLVIDEIEGVLPGLIGHPVIAIAGTDWNRKQEWRSNR